MDARARARLDRTLRNERSRVHDRLALDDMAGTYRVLHGQFMINSAGEAEVEIDFPFKFTEKPLMSFGFEMRDGEPYVRGQMATGSAMVIDWKTEERPPLNRFYTGCTLGVVTSGLQYQKMIGVFHASGMAFTNPMGRY